MRKVRPFIRRLVMPNRTICDVLKEIRECNKTKNYSYLEGLIEEIQSMANRMEAALWDQNDVEYARKELKKLEIKIKALKASNPEVE